jgi:hypothetical protein
MVSYFFLASTSSSSFLLISDVPFLNPFPSFSCCHPSPLFLLILLSGIILWEILTGDVPYKELDGFSAYQFDDKIIAGYRPGIPKGFETHPFVQLMTACWQGNPKGNSPTREREE